MARLLEELEQLLREAERLRTEVAAEMRAMRPSERWGTGENGSAGGGAGGAVWQLRRPPRAS